MPRNRHQKGRRRAPLGHLTPEQLVAHRELEFLRVAGQPRPRSVAAAKRHRQHLERRAFKLEDAKRLAGEFAA
jgi:hypothetical protein